MLSAVKHSACLVALMAGCTDATERRHPTAQSRLLTTATPLRPAGFYSDSVCPYPPGTPCEGCGDGKCYRPCKVNADCIEATSPNCVAPVLFGGSDYGKAQDFRVCIATPTWKTACD